MAGWSHTAVPAAAENFLSDFLNVPIRRHPPPFAIPAAYTNNINSWNEGCFLVCWLLPSHQGWFSPILLVQYLSFLHYNIIDQRAISISARNLLFIH